MYRAAFPFTHIDCIFKQTSFSLCLALIYNSDYGLVESISLTIQLS